MTSREDSPTHIKFNSKILNLKEILISVSSFQHHRVHLVPSLQRLWFSELFMLMKQRYYQRNHSTLWKRGARPPHLYTELMDLGTNKERMCKFTWFKTTVYSRWIRITNKSEHSSLLNSVWCGFVCNPKPVTAVSATDHWACFKDVQVSRLLRHSVKHRSAARVHNAPWKECAAAQHPIWRQHTRSKVSDPPSCSCIAVSFLNNFKIIKRKCSRKYTTSTNAFWKEIAFVQNCRPFSSCSSFYYVNLNSLLRRKGSPKL